MEYKRLTNNNLDEYNPEYDFCVGCEYFGEPNGCNRSNGTCGNYERFMETYNRLAELENKIEQGTMIELPCKVGDTVYGFSCYRQFGSLSGKIFKGKVIAFYIERGLYIRIEAEYDNGNFYLEYGKEVFLTREEAENKLKDIQG